MAQYMTAKENKLSSRKAKERHEARCWYNYSRNETQALSEELSNTYGRTVNVPDTILLKAKSCSFPLVGLFPTEQDSQNTIFKAMQAVLVSCQRQPFLLAGRRSWWLAGCSLPRNPLRAGLPGGAPCRSVGSRGGLAASTLLESSLSPPNWLWGASELGAAPRHRGNCKSGPRGTC